MSRDRRRNGDPEDLDVGGLRDDNGGVSLSRQGLRVWGRQAVPLMSLAAVLALGGGWFYVQRGNVHVDSVTTTALRERMVNSKNEHEAILTAIRENTEATREMVREVAIQTWLLSQPQDKRPRLVMPRGLADRVMAP